MTTTITLPDYLVRQLQQQASVRHRSIEALVIEYVETALGEEAAEEEESLEALVARIKAMPPNPASIILPKGDLAAVLRDMVAGEPDMEVLAALDAAEKELRANDRANGPCRG